MEQGLYAKVIMIHRKDLNITEANKNLNKAKFKFQGQSERSQYWFGIDFDWVEEKFSTLEPDFYRKIYQRHDETKYTNIFKMFGFPIRNSKCVG